MALKVPSNLWRLKPQKVEEHMSTHPYKLRGLDREEIYVGDDVFVNRVSGTFKEEGEEGAERTYVSVMKTQYTTRGNARKMVAAEVAAASRFDHHLLATPVATKESAEVCCLAYVDGGVSLQEWTETFREAVASGNAAAIFDEIRTIAYCVLRGLSEVHKHLLVHHDIKAANLLRGADGIVQVADFGTLVAAGSKELLGWTASYPPVDVLHHSRSARGAHNTGKVDVLALGLVLYDLLTTRHGFYRAECALSFMRRAPPAGGSSDSEDGDDTDCSLCSSASSISGASSPAASSTAASLSASASGDASSPAASSNGSSSSASGDASSPFASSNGSSTSASSGGSSSGGSSDSLEAEIAMRQYYDRLCHGVYNTRIFTRAYLPCLGKELGPGFEDLIDLMSLMFQPEEERPTSKELLSHRYFTGEFMADIAKRLAAHKNKFEEDKAGARVVAELAMSAEAEVRAHIQAQCLDVLLPDTGSSGNTSQESTELAEALAAAQAKAAAAEGEAVAAVERVGLHKGQVIKGLKRQAELQQQLTKLAAQADAEREQLQAAHAAAAAHQQRIKELEAQLRAQEVQMQQQASVRHAVEAAALKASQSQEEQVVRLEAALLAVSEDRQQLQQVAEEAWRERDALRLQLATREAAHRRELEAASVLLQQERERAQQLAQVAAAKAQLQRDVLRGGAAAAAAASPSSWQLPEVGSHALTDLDCDDDDEEEQLLLQDQGSTAAAVAAAAGPAAASVTSHQLADLLLEEEQEAAAAAPAAESPGASWAAAHKALNTPSEDAASSGGGGSDAGSISGESSADCAVFIAVACGSKSSAAADLAASKDA